MPGQLRNVQREHEGHSLPKTISTSILSRTRTVSSPTRQTITIRSGDTASRGTASKLANTAIPTITWPIVKRNDLIEELRMRDPIIPW